MKQIRNLRALAGLLSAILLLGALMTAHASAAPSLSPPGTSPATVFLDGREVLRGKCVSVNGVTYVPMRDLSLLLDECRVTWNEATRTVTVKTDSLTVEGRVGDLWLFANGHYYYTEEEIRSIGGLVYVPIRPLVRAFGGTVGWNETKNRAEIRSSVGVAAVKKASYNADEVYWLARIISAEAGGEPFRGQIAVGNVVLNRVRSRDYPNTIYGVIFDRKYGVQFTPVANGTIYKTPTESAVIAAKICLEGDTLSDTALFFLNPRIATSNWISRTRPYAFTIGGHDFYN